MPPPPTRRRRRSDVPPLRYDRRRSSRPFVFPVVFVGLVLVLSCSGVATAFRSPVVPPSSTTTPTTRRRSSSAASVVVGAVAAAGEEEKKRECDDDGGLRMFFFSSRRSFLVRAAAATAIPSVVVAAAPSLADDGSPSSASSSLTFEKSTPKYAYKFQPPPNFAQGKKPLQTHLDEVNFNSEGVRGYSFGITVDPVRIGSLREFGTPEEVAARVVTAEVNRDGVFEVTQVVDPIELPNGGAYRIEYVSDGKRGKKRYLTKIDIRGGMLYVLTCQSKEEEFDGVRREEMERALESFVVTKE